MNSDKNLKFSSLLSKESWIPGSCKSAEQIEPCDYGTFSVNYLLNKRFLGGCYITEINFCVTVVCTSFNHTFLLHVRVQSTEKFFVKNEANPTNEKQTI